jgi:hypothetical protein
MAQFFPHPKQRETFADCRLLTILTNQLNQDLCQPIVKFGLIPSKYCQVDLIQTWEKFVTSLPNALVSWPVGKEAQWYRVELGVAP